MTSRWNKQYFWVLFIELTNKQYPKILFIPTASHDDESYIKLFLDTFEKQ
jgi:dipeptidase E